MKDPIELARECGATVYTNRHYPHQPAVAFGNKAWTDFCARSRELMGLDQEPFGYFKAEPFGWTDCAETDEGAVALYDRAAPSQETAAKIISNLEPLLAAKNQSWDCAEKMLRDLLAAAHGIGEKK